MAVLKKICVVVLLVLMALQIMGSGSVTQITCRRRKRGGFLRQIRK